MYLFNVTIHVMAALLWLGGMFFLAAVGAPVLRKVQPPELRAALFRDLGQQFRTVGWIAIAVLLVTGVLNLHLRRMLPLLDERSFWETRFGVTLAWKVGGVAVMLLIQGIHDFHLGPAASRLPPGSPDLPRLRRNAALLARTSAVLGIIVVIAAVRLARGG